MLEMYREKWTNERLALLHEMRARGPKIIWEALNKLPGPHITKPAVIGMRDRKYMVRQPEKTEAEVVAMLLARRNRDNEARRAKRAANPKSRAINFNRIEAARNRVDPEPFVCAEPADIKPLHKRLLDLDSDECRYPYGDDPRTMTFCGHRALRYTVQGMQRQSSYCHAHHMICTAGIPVQKRVGYVNLGRSSGGVFGRVA